MAIRARRIAWARPGQPLTVTVGCSDPDGDPLAYQLASKAGNGSVEQTGPATFVYTARRDYRGEDGVLVLARDGRGGSALISTRIAVDDPAPVCAAPAPLVLRPLRRGKATIACSDPDGGRCG
ncbi:Ig-like domain-containing protein [Conexibacter sp. JD483]|uniref:Ig-like domain-containing protein n=1 Tax=unclassified Conexibacter TaxID=2627773 RepID=UPI002721D3F1|nr:MULTISPECIES: Ig-like domain-containing protein [unclassified Conexibacter]MDO8187786.1 Ig-like domain-containing protein [Conexibacter sp. CPCC 205706]MDO8201974.1 Ig-like domain-containing protein [Conexibacter sp. CPCC 205762]MDR9372562.1 Ig-like domain-containing protein [Conexibacter sp. JD483]